MQQITAQGYRLETPYTRPYSPSPSLIIGEHFGQGGFSHVGEKRSTAEQSRSTDGSGLLRASGNLNRGSWDRASTVRRGRRQWGRAARRSAEAGSPGGGARSRVGGGGVGWVEDPAPLRVSLARHFLYLPERGGHLLVDDMSHTVGEEDVGLDNLGAVDEDAAVLDGHRDGRSLQGVEGRARGQGGAVAYGTSDDVILKDGRQLGCGQVRREICDGSKGGVCRGEDSNILERRQSWRILMRCAPN